MTEKVLHADLVASYFHAMLRLYSYIAQAEDLINFHYNNFIEKKTISHSTNILIKFLEFQNHINVNEKSFSSI